MVFLAQSQVILSVVIPIRMQKRLDRDVIHFLQDPSEPLSTVIDDYEAMLAFREFLKSEFSVENMDFCCTFVNV